MTGGKRSILQNLENMQGFQTQSKSITKISRLNYKSRPPRADFQNFQSKATELCVACSERACQHDFTKLARTTFANINGCPLAGLNQHELLDASPVVQVWSKRYGFDAPALRDATPTARFGNLFVFRGSFFVPGLFAEDRYWTAMSKLYVEKPDIAEGDKLLRESAALDPKAFYVNIHLGSVCLRRGSREDALATYRAALEHAPEACFANKLRNRFLGFPPSL